MNRPILQKLLVFLIDIDDVVHLITSRRVCG